MPAKQPSVEKLIILLQTNQDLKAALTAAIKRSR